MHKQQSVLENETHKILWDGSPYPSQETRPSVYKQKKKKRDVSTGGLCGSSRSQSEAEGK